jgi:hypothetical protein
LSGQKNKDISTKSTKAWAKSAIERIKNARGILSIHRDTVGLIKQGSEAPTLMHDAAMLLAQARTKLEIAEIKFDIWMARQRRVVREQLLIQREKDKFVYTHAPTPEKRNMAKPAEVKEAEVKDEILMMEDYRKRREEICTLKYTLEIAEKAYFKPMDTRASMIMSLNKIVNREPVE